MTTVYIITTITHTEKQELTINPKPFQPVLVLKTLKVLC